jgi:tetratricopeptide (TPR) repeat protein
MGNFDPARAAFSKALGLNPKDAAAANGLLDAVETLDKKEELPGAYAAVLRVDSNHVKALAGLSGIRLAGGGYEEAAQLLRRLTAARPEDAAAFADYGQALQALNRTGEAKDAFAKAYDLGDHRPLVVGSLVRQHRKSGTLDAALPILEEWLRQSPEDDEAAAWAADLAEKSGDWHKAEEMWALAWQAKPGQIRYLEGLGRAYARSGENEFAAELLAPHAPQFGVQGLVLLGDVYAAIPQPEKALKAYRMASALKPSAQAAAGEIRVHLSRKQTAEAKRVFDKAGSLAGDSDLEKARVLFHLQLRDLDKALALAKGVAAANTRDASAQLLLGEVLLARRDGQGALRAFETAGKLDTSLFESLHMAGRAYLQLGKTTEARSAFFALGEKTDRRARTLGLLGLGEMSLRMGRDEEAKDYWMQAATLRPTAQVLSDLASLCARLKRVEEAEVFSQRALEMEEDFPDAIAALSDAMVARSEAKEAREYLQEALQKNPLSCELLLALSRSHLALEDAKSLTYSSEKARRICPDDPMPWYYAGVAAAKSEKSQDAATHFARYRQLGGAADMVPKGY